MHISHKMNIVQVIKFVVKYIVQAVARPPDGIHPNVIERGIHIRPYRIERRPQHFNEGD